MLNRGDYDKRGEPVEPRDQRQPCSKIERQRGPDQPHRPAPGRQQTLDRRGVGAFLCGTGQKQHRNQDAPDKGGKIAGHSAAFARVIPRHSGPTIRVATGISATPRISPNTPSTAAVTAQNTNPCATGTIAETAVARYLIWS